MVRGSSFSVRPARLIESMLGSAIQSPTLNRCAALIRIHRARVSSMNPPQADSRLPQLFDF
jgi:hypothetical protein